MLKSVIFDLDDTLIDWSGFGDNWEALQIRHLSGVFEYLCECAPLTDFSVFAAEFRSRTIAAWTSSRDDLLAPNVSTIMIDTAVALGVPKDVIDLTRLHDAYRWGVIDGTQAFPEVIETLRQLRSAGLRFGIVTNAYQPMAMRDTELEQLGLAEFFPECRFSAADHGYLKPHPSIFRAALDCLDCAPEESVFVGDDYDADIVGAKQAGLFAVYREVMRRRSGPGLNGIQPDAVIRSLTELPAVFDAAFPGWRGES